MPPAWGRWPLGKNGAEFEPLLRSLFYNSKYKYFSFCYKAFAGLGSLGMVSGAELGTL